MKTTDWKYNEFVHRWGAPIIRYTIESPLSEEVKQINNIPDEYCIFRIRTPPGVMVISRYGKEWIENTGHRCVIAHLLDICGIER